LVSDLYRSIQGDNPLLRDIKVAAKKMSTGKRRAGYDYYLMLFDTSRFKSGLKCGLKARYGFSNRLRYMGLHPRKRSTDKKK